MTPLFRDEEREEEEELERGRGCRAYMDKKMLPGKGMWMRKTTCGQRKVAGRI
jgi:hypothetical protein